MMNPDHAKRIRQRIETMNKLRGRPLTNVEKLANIRRWLFDEEDAMDKDHAKRVLEHQMKTTPRDIIAMWLGKSLSPSPLRLQEADRLIEKLVAAGYAIEPIEDDHED